MRGRGSACFGGVAVTGVGVGAGWPGDGVLEVRALEPLPAGCGGGVGVVVFGRVGVDGEGGGLASLSWPVIRRGG